MKKNNITSGSSMPPRKKYIIILVTAFLCIVFAIGIMLYFKNFNVFINVKPGTVSSELNEKENGILLYTDPLCGSCAEP